MKKKCSHVRTFPRSTQIDEPIRMVITVLLIFQMVTVDARVTYGVERTQTDDVNFRRNEKTIVDDESRFIL